MASKEITHLLQEWHMGNQQALHQLIPLVYDELHGRAQSYIRKEFSNHSLSSTELVNEAYFHLIKEQDRTFECRRHFFAVAANIMRHFLIHRAQARRAQKRGGDQIRIQMEDIQRLPFWDDHRLLELDGTLDLLRKQDPRKAHLFELRYLLGLSLNEIVEESQLSLATVKRELSFTKAWLRSNMDGLI